mgnify:FL=1
MNTVYISERLQESLRLVSRCALTTVVAPMDYGKTTAVNWYLEERARLEEFANNGKVGGLVLRGGELTLALNTGYVFANVLNAIDMRDIDGIRKWFAASLTGMAGLLDILRKSPALTDTVSQA